MKLFFSYIKNKITTLPTLTSFLFLVILLSILTFIKIKYFNTYEDFKEGLLVEFYGTAFEVFIIGFLILWVNGKGLTNKENQNFQQDLYDFQRMDSLESMLLKIISIRRLNRNGITNIDLEKNILLNVDLQGVNLSSANLKNSRFEGCNFKNAIFHESNFQNSDLTNSDFTNADFTNADLTNTIITPAQLKKAKTLYKTKLDKNILDILDETIDSCDNLFQPKYYCSLNHSKSEFHMQR